MLKFELWEKFSKFKVLKAVKQEKKGKNQSETETSMMKHEIPVRILTQAM